MEPALPNKVAAASSWAAMRGEGMTSATYCVRIPRDSEQRFHGIVNRVLEHGESDHALQRQICAQLLPAKRGRRAEELMVSSNGRTAGSLHPTEKSQAISSPHKTHSTMPVASVTTPVARHSTAPITPRNLFHPRFANSKRTCLAAMPHRPQPSERGRACIPVSSPSA